METFKRKAPIQIGAKKMRPTPERHNFCRLVQIAGSVVLAMAALEPANAQTWTQLSTSGGPPTPRTLTSAVFDHATDQMIVFGGNVNMGALNVDSNDLWSLSLGASQWTAIQPAGNIPPPRNNYSAVYDDANARMVVFGGGLGQSSPCANDVWVLSNANGVAGTPTWAQLAPGGPAPSPRNAHSAVYDPASNRMIVFGGDNCFQTFNNEVWVLSNANGLGGAPAWTQLAPAGTPPAPSESQSAVYDPGTNRMILFGINPFGGPLNNQVWILTNANGLGGSPAWIQLAPAGPAISARSDTNGVAYNPSTNQMFVFAGFSGMTDLNDTWVLSNANGLGGTPVWTQIAQSGTLPPSRDSFASVFDSATNRLIVFGGESDTIPLNDVWILSSAQNHRVCLLYDPTKAVHSGATIPVKLQLCDANGNDQSSSTITLHATGVVQSSTSISGTVEDSGDANPDSDFRFDSTLGPTGGYIFNLSTKGLSTGTYTLTFTVSGDSGTFSAPFQVK